VDGAMAVLEAFPEAITIFIHAGSIEELERRLRARGTESAASLERRLEVARRELTLLHRYQHQVVNNDISTAVRQICEILTQVPRN
jgi:guanylate kinase